MAVELSKSGRDRASGENFAAMFSQLQIDVDSDARSEDMVGHLVSGETSQQFRDYLLQDRYIGQVTHLERRFNADADAWLRSAAEGGGEEPSRLQVELAAEVQSSVQSPGDRMFMVTRIDVDWEGDGWRVTDFANGFVGNTPAGAGDLLRDALSGDGWRRLS
ncbi:hypothetical protein [Nocardioides sp.]|uniref:hypothetical protein n=1 Tax=Nocardioides sp. TaxID=35761 RepID=UPI0039E3F95C